MTDLRLIVVEDDDDDAQLVAEALQADGYHLDWQRVDSAAGLADALRRGAPDLVVSDYRVPGFRAEDALRAVQRTGRDIPFILISGKIGEDAVVAMMHTGAHDYVSKDSLYRLPPAVRRELREADSRRQRRAAQEALRHSEEDFRLLAEHVQDIIFRCLVHPRFEVSYLSPATTEITGYAPAELLGDPDRFLSHLADPQERAALEESWRTGRQTSLLVRWRRPDGSTRWLEQRAQGVCADGPLTAVEGTLRDVTDRELAHREHDLLVQQLHQAERLESLGLLAGGVAHDFNNALAVILNCASFLAEDLPADQSSRADVDRIIEAARRSAALASQLLVFARRQPESTQVVDLNAVVTGIKEMITRSIGEDIEFSCDTTPAPALVALDRSRFEQVILNLVVNARAAMPDGGRLAIRTTVVTSVPAAPGRAPRAARRSERQYVRLTVADTGHGMPPDVARRAFDPFFTTKPPGEGTGLGLATAYGVVRQAGGHIAIASQPGNGTTITIHLPLTDQHSSPETGDTSTPPGRGRGETVLVVEDDRAVRDVVAAILTRHNYRVMQASCAAEALTHFGAASPRIDLVLTDLVMPGMSGTQLASRIRAIRPYLPILFMTGYASEAPLPPDGGVTGMLQKPFTQQRLLARLRETLDLASARDRAPD